MLKYTIKPSKNVELKSFPIRELFVCPDLSYISGITDVKVGLVNGEKVIIKSPYLIGNEVTTINVQNVKRQGKVKLSIKLPVKKITLPLNFPIYGDNNSEENYIMAFNKKVSVESEGESVISSVTQNYVEYNGDICYFFHSNPNGYMVNHKFYEASINDETITIETYSYIEDGKLQVGDYTYYADFSKENEEPKLSIGKEYKPIEPGQDNVISLIDGCECYYESITDYEKDKWERVSKFYIEKKENPVFEVDDVVYGGYKHYVIFNDENYYIRDVYQYDEETENNIYAGYGIMFEDEFYEALPNYNNALCDKYHDLKYGGSYLYIGKYDEYLEIHDSLISPSNGGCFLLLMCSDEGSDVIPGNFIIAESNCSIEIKRTVETDDDEVLIEERGYGNEYIEFEGKKYLIEDKLFDTINVSGEDYLLTYLKFDDNGKPTSASTIINGETMYFDVTGTTAKLSDKIYYRDNNSEKIMVKYGINENTYLITESSGVTVNGKVYRVIDESVDADIDAMPSKYVLINEMVKVALEITDKNGSSTYLTYPVIDDETIDDISKNELQREYCDIIVNNWKLFNFKVRKDTFGDKPLTVENWLMNSMTSSLPYSISNIYSFENNIEILRTQNYLTFKLPLSNNTANNIRREDTINNDFVDEIKKESINTVVDMEKDVYYPMWKDDNDELKPIQQIRFNLHFRTRNFDNWKIYEDDREFNGDDTLNYQMSNWFITDLNYYKNDCSNNMKKLHNSSDLLGLMNFNTNEIKNQSTKVGKSFLRLSFYSTNDPKTQVLLATSTIFFDENLAYKKYINSKRNSDLIFIDVKTMQEAGYEKLNDYKRDVANKKDKFQVSSNTISVSSEVYTDKFFNDDSRLSSRLVVNDKYNTDTSSEGYYIYLFKDYSTKMRESTIYMKVDFNHAGIGKTMSFMLPRMVGNGDVDGAYGKPLYLHNSSDVSTLKNGFNINDIYKQTHIPINVIYDDKNNKYVYYLPKALRENKELEVDDEIMEFNLFEIKFANESIVKNKSYENNQ